MTPEQRLLDMLELERLRYSELETQERRRFDARRRDLGLLRIRQPHRIAILTLEAWQDYLSALVDGSLHIRHELAALQPELATEQQLSRLEGQLESLVMQDQSNHRQQNIEEFARPTQLGAAVISSIMNRSKQRDWEILGRMRNKIGQIRIEFRHGLHQSPPEKNVKIELNNSTVNILQR